MKKFIIFCLLLVFSIDIQVEAQKDSTRTFGEDKIEAEYYFGFNLIENSYGAMMHLVLLKPGDNRKHKIIQLTKDGFIAQASGKQKSLANPNGIDFFKEYEIKNPNVLDNVWRLRYKEYPYFSNQKIEPGWSANDSIPFIPTEAQMQILQKFGLNRMSDFIFGENAFRLLKLMEQPEWINSYKESY